MVELLTDLPDNVVGIVASGMVSADEYEKTLMPAIEAALKLHKHIRILYQLSSAFTGFTAGAMWDGTKLGLSHISAWERCAIVSDTNWITGVARLFSFVFPCPLRVFTNEQLAEAKRWISAD